MYSIAESGPCLVELRLPRDEALEARERFGNSAGSAARWKAR